MHCGVFLVQPFLLEDEIQPVYQQLSLQVTTAPLTQFENYMTKTRISCNKCLHQAGASTWWPPEATIRLNSWHKGLNIIFHVKHMRFVTCYRPLKQQGPINDLALGKSIVKCTCKSLTYKKITTTNAKVQSSYYAQVPT